MPRSRRSAVTLCAIPVAAFALGFGAPRASRDTIPDRLADSTFWRIVSTFSEPSGYFASENFVSNENELQFVIPRVVARVPAGSAYLGVGPEQNFTYIAALRPKIAFICDIRRQNLIEHLMYKALMEMSTDRADFLSKLWARTRPDSLDASSTATALVAAYRDAKPDSLLFQITLGDIFGRLVHTHKFALTPEDSATLRVVYTVFYVNGPDISYGSASRGIGQGPPAFAIRGAPFVGPGSAGTIRISNGAYAITWRLLADSSGRAIAMRDSNGVLVRDTVMDSTMARGGLFPVNRMPLFAGGWETFGSLMTADDGAGVNRGWLGSEAAFRTVKDYESRNLIVPVVGDFGGPKALRAVAGYLKEHSARVGTFYTSNVEQYLFQYGSAPDFYRNVGELPTDSSSAFIRSYPPSPAIGSVPRTPRSRLVQMTSGIEAVVSAFQSGKLTSYYDLAQLRDQ